MRNGLLKFTLLLSILVGVIPLLFHERLFDKNEVDVTLPDTWNQMPSREKLDCLGGLLSRNEPFFLLSEIKQLNIKGHLRKMIVDKEDALLRNGFQYTLGFRYDLGWKELSLLGAAGFASVWVLYIVVRTILLLIPSAPMIRFPAPASTGRTEYLCFNQENKPTSLVGVKITLFNFLVLREEPRRPPKPSAVWID